MADIVQEQIDCTKAEEFLTAISPLGPNITEQTPNNGIWLFRGQWDDWKPIPSLFRKDENARKKLQSLTKEDINSKFIEDIERDILIYFFEIADKRGLTLPDDSQELRSYLNKWKSNNSSIKKNTRLLDLATKTFSLTGLAQHYGMPTRLLDWTRKSFIAAFFAAENAIRIEPDIKKRLIVWAFYFPQLRNQNDSEIHDHPVHLITAPGASNINLQAQYGVFTRLNPAYTNEENGDYPAINEMLQELAQREAQKNGYTSEFCLSCKFKKFTLPQFEATKLLHLLGKLDITPSSIYPGYHSIVSDLQNETRWE